MSRIKFQRLIWSKFLARRRRAAGQREVAKTVENTHRRRQVRWNPERAGCPRCRSHRASWVPALPLAHGGEGEAWPRRWAKSCRRRRGEQSKPEADALGEPLGDAGAAGEAEPSAGERIVLAPQGPRSGARGRGADGHGARASAVVGRGGGRGRGAARARDSAGEREARALPLAAPRVSRRARARAKCWASARRCRTRVLSAAECCRRARPCPSSPPSRWWRSPRRRRAAGARRLRLNAREHQSLVDECEKSEACRITGCCDAVRQSMCILGTGGGL